MLTQRLFVVMIGLLVTELAAVHPLWSFSPLFVSAEDEGFVRNIEYTDHLRSSEEVTTKTGDNLCATISLTNTPPKILEKAYRIFAEILVRDSRTVSSTKLKEVKAMYTDKETSIGYFFLMRRNLGKVNITWEGKAMYNAIKEIAANTSNSNKIENEPAWLDQMIVGVVCGVLRAQEQDDADNLVDQITFEKEISEHFDVFTRFWLDYPKSNRAQYQSYTTNTPIRQKKQATGEVSCVIPAFELAVTSANTAYRAFAAILVRDSATVVESKLKANPVNRKEKFDLSAMLRNIESYEISNGTMQGRLMHQKLQRINQEMVEEMDEEGSTWLRDIVDRIFCLAQKVHTESDFKLLVGNTTMTDAIKEHFDVFKQFWLN
ncbi:uncharacterized protein LOC125779401 isoform X1 [Bactrocera dorsalis]|uniref:Uncharacterized protein LOC125779401 isoform X1 n=1 Tax=Bactrocera dorsalis TaxID=27457 RepID=A0ABM3K5F1_BACDO|nr:uncharacterized protein LOC125779401 isoform X1 [Bactrocera dorsalis]